MRDPILYLLLAGTLVPAFVGTAIFFHQGYLIELRHYDPLVFAASFTVMSVTTIVFGFACGYLVDRFGSLSLLPYFLLPMAIASLLLGLVAPEWGLYAFMLLMGVSNGFTSTLLGALWPEVYGLANLGGIRAITVSAMVLSSALGPRIHRRPYGPWNFATHADDLDGGMVRPGILRADDRRMEGAAKKHDSSANVKGEPLTCLPALQMIAVAAKARTSRL
jgi:MFS family permease